MNTLTKTTGTLLLALLGACGDKPSESPEAVECVWIENSDPTVYDCKFALIEIKYDENNEPYMFAKPVQK